MPPTAAASGRATTRPSGCGSTCRLRRGVKMARMKAITAIALSLLLAACAAPGPPRNDDVFARIELGMTRDDAARIVGRPDETMRFDARGTQSWDYYYFDTWGYYCRYS